MMPKRVEITEVDNRDGLPSETQFVSTHRKIAMRLPVGDLQVRRAAAAGQARRACRA